MEQGNLFLAGGLIFLAAFSLYIMYSIWGRMRAGEMRKELEKQQIKLDSARKELAREIEKSKSQMPKKEPPAPSP
jgi:hypothetical protein